jgi:hypothetical protein
MEKRKERSVKLIELKALMGLAPSSSCTGTIISLAIESAG